MKAYTVHDLFVSPYTGQVMAQISFNETALEKFFPSLEFANKYLIKSKRDWFLVALEKFIMHKKQIIDNSQVSTEKQKALAVCLEAYKVYCDKPLNVIASGFLKGKNYFELLLPHNSNNSFESSQNNLNELIKFCETETFRK